MEEVTGRVTTIVEFTNTGAVNTGAEPRAMLVNDGKGYFWGSTSEGGPANAGTIFKVKISTGELTTVLEFTNQDLPNRGARPNGELVNDGNGFFWGTTFEGTASGGGSIFKVNENTGELITVYQFANYVAGRGPYAALTPDGTGSFLGTTNRGGPFSDFGTIFKINATTAQFTNLINFTGLGPPYFGTEPRSKLLNDAPGSFWGITSEGGLQGEARGLGSIYRVDAPSGRLNTVVLFTGVGGSIKGPNHEPN
jgi:uncharacterized repeat protein (TIGR03803 family)